jgi:regulator of protease activity HflC (stomatin/prohibitin superfamily)
MHRADKRAELAAFLGFGLQAVFFGLLLVLFKINNSAATFAESWHFLAGAGIWLLVFVELYQRRLAWQQRTEVEELERQRLGQIAGTQSVFNQVSVDEELPMERRLQLMQKWFIPIFSVIIAAGLGFFALRLFPKWWPMAWVTDAMENAVRSQPATLIIIAGVSLICFLSSRYCLGLSRTKGWRVLRAGANYMMGNALMTLVLSVVLALSYYEITMPERVLAQILPLLMALLAVEIILNLVLDMYRPRIAGEENRPSYESRIMGLFCEPEGVMRSIAHTIDYQFGFTVSDTWFYKLLQEAIVPLVLFGAVTLYLMGIIVIVRPGEQAVVSRFGEKPASVLNEGFHVKLPWPIDSVKVYKVDEIRQKVIGFSGDSSIFDLTNPKPEPILWTVKHVTGDEFQLLVASKEIDQTGTGQQAMDALPSTQPVDEKDQEHLSPVNIISGTVVVEYQIRSDEKGEGLLDFVTHYDNPEAIIEAVAYRRLTQYVASVDPMGIMTTDKAKATDYLKKSIQAELDQRQTGVNLVRVSLIGLHPALEIADAFEAAINARQEKETVVWWALGEANERLPQARAMANETFSEAESKRYAKVIVEQAKAQRFKAQLQSYTIAPEVYFTRNYLDMLAQSTMGVRKYIIALENPKKVYLEVDDKEKLSSGLLGLGEEISQEIK